MENQLRMLTSKPLKVLLYWVLIYHLDAEFNAGKLGSQTSNSSISSPVPTNISLEEAGKILNITIPGSSLEQVKEVFVGSTNHI